MGDKEGIPNESPEATDNQNQTSGVNYHDRIRSEPDFAVEQIQEKDRYIGQLNESKARYKPLEQYIDAVGGEELARLAGIGNQVETNPKLKQILQDSINGVTPPKASEPEEEIYDPEIKAMRDRYDETITDQNTIIQELKVRLDKTEAISLKGSLSENVGTALTVFEDDPELLEEAKTEITRAVGNLETAAKGGDRSAANQLEQLANPQGSKTFRMMTIDIYDKYHAKKLEAATNQPNGEITLSKATDARTTTRSALPTDTIAIKSGVKVTSQLVAEVMEKAARKLGKDPDSLFN